MMELAAYFDGMSKPMLREVHARAFGKKGLLNNALIQSEVLSFYSSHDRLAAFMEKLEFWQRRCLELIYLSGTRGLSYNELRLSVPALKSGELQKFLLNLCTQYYVWRSSTSNTEVYFGFKDFAGLILFVPESEELAKGTAIGYSTLLDWHICRVLGLAQRGELKINANGTRKSKKY